MSKKFISMLLALTLALSLTTVGFAAMTPPSAIVITGMTVTLGSPGKITGGFIASSATQAVAGTLAVPYGVDLVISTPSLTGISPSNVDIKFQVYNDQAAAEANDNVSNWSSATQATLENGKVLGIVAADPADSGDGIYYILNIVVEQAAPPASPSNSSPATTTTPGIVTGGGDTEWVDLKVFDMTLPTGELLKFNLDPQGLLALKDVDNLDITKLEGGNIYAGNNVGVVNNSTEKVDLSLKLKGTGDAAFVPFVASGGGKNDWDNTVAALATTGTENLLLYAVPSSENIATVASNHLANGYVAAANAYVITENESTLKFELDAADYVVRLATGADKIEASRGNNVTVRGKYAFELQEGTGNGQAFKLGGKVNTNVSWADYVPATAGTPAVKNVGVQAVFSFTETTTDRTASAANYVTGVYGMVKEVANANFLTPEGNSGDSLTFPDGAKVAIANAPAEDLEFSKGNDTSYTIYLTNATKTAVATEVTKVRNNTTGYDLTAGSYSYNAESGALKLNSFPSRSSDFTVTAKIDGTDVTFHWQANL